MPQRSRITIVHSDAGTGGARGATALTPQYLADQLTLFQPGEGILSSPRGCPKIIFIRLKIKVAIVQKVTQLVFCQNDSPIRDHFGKKTA